MVGRRRDQADTGRGVAGVCNPRIDLRRRQLAALTRLGALSELDLDVIRVRQIHARDTETTGRHLLDCASTFRVEKPIEIFAALTSVRFRAQSVHRDREGLVRLLRNGAVAHRARRKPFHNRFDRLDLVEWHGGTLAGAKLKHTAQGHQVLGLVVDELRVLTENVIAPRARGVLQAEDRLRVEQVR